MLEFTDLSQLVGDPRLFLIGVVFLLFGFGLVYTMLIIAMFGVNVYILGIVGLIGFMFGLIGRVLIVSKREQESM